MFGEILGKILDDTKGAVAVTLMGFDGIPIDSKERDGDDARTHQTAVIELAALASQARRVSESLGTGEVEEFSVANETMTTILRPLTDEYLLAISVTKGGLLGKGRYLLRIATPALVKELT